MISTQVLILGGGPAGLALGWQLRQRGVDFRILEAGAAVGGNARTLRHGPFLYDTGAHRLHGRDAEALADFRSLLGENMLPVDAPSQIVWQGRRLDFPLSPLNLLRRLGPGPVLGATASVLWQRLRGGPLPPDFAGQAIRKYGRGLAERFLLGYSEKLWGLPAHRLSPAISGARLRGLNLSTLLREALVGRSAKTEHLDGAFWYPRLGIGMLTDALAQACGPDSICTGARVTALHVQDGRVNQVNTADGRQFQGAQVVSTLPLPQLMRMLDPLPDADTLAAAETFRFRGLIVLGMVVEKPQVTANASLYFPDPDIPFTRLYEPRNRSAAMSPAGRTCILLEIPCFPGDPITQDSAATLAARCLPALTQAGLVHAADVSEVFRHYLPEAYPVLELGLETPLQLLHHFTRSLHNFHIAGRNGQFAYLHLQDMMQQARDLAAGFMR